MYAIIRTGSKQYRVQSGEDAKIPAHRLVTGALRAAGKLGVASGDDFRHEHPAHASGATDDADFHNKPL